MAHSSWGSFLQGIFEESERVKILQEEGTPWLTVHWSARILEKRPPTIKPVERDRQIESEARRGTSVPRRRLGLRSSPTACLLTRFSESEISTRELAVAPRCHFSQWPKYYLLPCSVRKLFFKPFIRLQGENRKSKRWAVVAESRRAYLQLLKPSKWREPQKVISFPHILELNSTIPVCSNLILGPLKRFLTHFLCISF